MAIKSFTVDSDLVMYIKLKNGKSYKDCDMTENPLGNSETTISFWYNNYVIFCPLENVEYYEVYERVK